LEPPAPDIVIDGADLGVEITEFYAEEALKRFESEQQLVLEKGRTICAEMGLPPVIVKVFWNAGASSSMRVRTSLAQELVKVVAKNIPQIDSQIDIEQDGESPSSLPSAIDLISIERWSMHKTHHWYSPRFAFVSEPSIQQIEARIAEKNAKCDGYRSACKYLWLLIVTEGTAPSSWVQLSESIRTYKYRSAFDQVFFFHRLYGQVIKLPTTQN